MNTPLISTLQIWAFRELLRRPLESMLLAAALTATIAVAGTFLLLPRAIFGTVSQLMENTPSVVVRRVGAGGWRPMPVREAVEAARQVVGVVSARPRVWGAVAGPDGPLTVIGVHREHLPPMVAGHPDPLPVRGQAIAGPGVYGSGAEGALCLKGAVAGDFQVVGRLPGETSLFTHDLVLTHMADARQLVGLEDGYASDLAVDVFHDGEESAILPDLSAAFPWSVQCTTRRQSTGVYADGLNRIGTIGTVAVIPAVLAVCLLVAVNVRKSMGRQTELGILKATGWCTADIVRLQMVRILSVCLPSAVFGSLASFLLVFWPGAAWTGRILLGWTTPPPMLYLDPSGAVWVLLAVAGLVLAPVAASALLPAVRCATRDVTDLIEGSSGP